MIHDSWDKMELFAKFKHNLLPGSEITYYKNLTEAIKLVVSYFNIWIAKLGYTNYIVPVVTFGLSHQENDSGSFTNS